MVRFSCEIKAIIFGFGLLFTLFYPYPSQAHNGVVAIAVPVEGITVDGDLSDWPAGMVKYPLARPEFGDPPQDESDFSGTFRIAYQAAEQALYIAVDVEDESTVITTSAPSDWDTQDGCEIYVAVGRGASSGVPIPYAIRGDTRLQDSVEGAVRRTDGHHTYE